MFGDHGLSPKRAFMYEACTRISMIIRHPEQIANRVEDTPCQSHDIAATVLILAQCQHDEQMSDSCNLLSSEDLRQRGHAVCMHRNSSVGHDGYYKLSYSPEPGPTDSWGELFDLKNDPGEMNNLCFDSSETPGISSCVN